MDKKDKQQEYPHAIRINTRDKINVKLAQSEISERAITSCKVAAELETLEAEFAAVKNDWKKKIEVFSSKLKELRRNVQTGEEFREVDCQRAFDLKRGVTWLEFENKCYLERPATQKEIELLQQGSLEDHMEPKDESDAF